MSHKHKHQIHTESSVLERDNLFGLESPKSDIVDVQEPVEEIVLEEPVPNSEEVDYHADILAYMEGTKGATPKWLAKKSKLQLKRVEEYLKTGKGLARAEELIMYIELLSKIKRNIEFEKLQLKRQEALQKSKKFIYKLEREGKVK